MRRLNLATVAVTAFAVAMLAACSADHSTDEAAIREANKTLLAAVAAKDATAAAAVYAEDGEFMAPNAPKAVGRPAIEEAWKAFLGLPGVTLTFETEKFIFAKSGDLAVDIGTYKSSIVGTADTGKSVVTWTKRDGKWFILTDMFSSDQPAGTPAPAAPDAASGTVPEGAPQPSPEAAPYSSGPAAPATPTAPAPAAPATEPAPAPATPN